MSIGGDRDDDIDELVDEISETNDLLRQLLRGLSGEGGGGGEDEEGDEGDRKGDLWRLGDVSESAISEDDYKDKRAKAARTESYTLPYVDFSFFDDDFDIVDFKVDMFMEGYDSFESARSSLSNKDFDEFVRKASIRLLGGTEAGLEAELIRELEMGPSTFGVLIVTRTIDVPGEPVPQQTEVLEFQEEKMAYDLLRIVNDHYNPATQPATNLGFEYDTTDSERIRPLGTIASINESVAKAAYRSSKVSMPDRLRGLLPDDFGSNDDDVGEMY